MSLARFLRSADARLRLDLVRPAVARVEGEALAPGRLGPGLLASAVANGIRMESARRAPASRGAWPAERAPGVLASLAPEMVGAAESALAFARGESGRASGVTASVVAERALQLARLEAVVRAGYVDARIGEPEAPEDVAEVAASLARVPWDVLGEDLLPPPAFPSRVDSLPDAEPDAVMGGTLLAVSASRAPRVGEDELRALTLRLVLARAEWGVEEAARRVRDLGVLLARHGVVWRAPASAVVGHEAFPAVEAWLLERLDLAGPEAQGPSAEERVPRAGPTPKWVRKRFAPRTPGTHPAGKAEKKKGTGSRARPPPPPRAARRDEPDEGGRDDEEPRPSFPKPDWRRGSKWRRDRGL